MITPRPLLLLAITGVLACSGSSRRASTTRTTGAGSPSLRTVDNAGYVDPGGRTRQVSAGGGPAPVGRGNGVAPTQHEKPPATEPPSPQAGPAPTAAAGDATEFIARAARALCDREQYCDRIGAGKVFESVDACMVIKRDRVRAVLADESCDEIRGDRLAACLTAIRGAACGPSAAPVQPPATCTGPALCGTPAPP